MGVYINFFKDVFAGKYVFNDFVGTLGQLLNDAGMQKLFEMIKGIGQALAFVAIAVGALQLLYGKKFLGLFKFVAFAGIGYAVGAFAIQPILPEILLNAINPTVCGVIFALIAAVLYKLLYVLVLFGLGGTFVYVIFYAGGLIPMELPTIGNATMSYVVVGIALFLLLIKKKNAERLGTAFLGSYLITYGVKMLYDYTALIPDQAKIINAIVLVALAIGGYVYQYRRRRRYY